MMKKLLSLSIFLVSFAFAEKTHNPIYVDATNGDDRSGAGTSSSPYQSLSKAIEIAVDGDSILVKAGTYTGSLNRNLSISKKLYIYSESGAASTILDAEQSDRHFYFTGTAVDSSFKLIGFTLKNGKPNSNDSGGSIYVTNGSNPVFDSCIFESNQTKHSASNYWMSGGAMYFTWGAPIIRDCTFKYNSSDAYGGAIYVNNSIDSINTVIERSTFYGNELTPYPYNESWGGAIYVQGSPNISDCTFDSNLVKMNSSWNNYGAAIYISGSYVNTSSTTAVDTVINIQRTIFKQNQVLAGDGGGGAKGGAVNISGRRKVIFENCLFNSNSVTSSAWSDQWGSYNSNGEGGAIRIEMYDRWSGSTYEPYNPVVFINNTFVNNVATGSGNNSGQGGAIYYSYRENSVMINNVFHGNSVNNNADSTDFDININTDSEFNFSNNAFQYFDGSKYGSEYNISSNDNKIGVDPAFDSSNTYPYSLHDRSQLIGAGIASLTVGSHTYSASSDDINKNSRPSPSGSNPDIGAYENALGTSPYPTNVSGVSATVANQQVTLTWALNTETDMASYKIYQSRTSGFSTSADSLVATVSHPSSGSTISTTLTGLTNKTTYYFLITAVDSDDYEGSPSAEVSAMPYYKGPTWYVATSANGGSDSNEGSSSAPFFSLKMAVDSASTGDTISIGAGTHQYTSSSYWNMNFNGSKSLIIKGQGKTSTILDAQSKDRHFYFGMGTAAIDTNFKVMDLTLKNGQPSSQDRGGSVYINAKWDQSSTSWSSSGPLFQNINFESNKSKSGTGEWDYNDGGAVYIDTWAAPHFRNVEFNYNINRGRGGAVFKQGNWNSRGNAPVFENCTFNGNESDAGANQWQASGGAVFIHGPAIFTNCVFDSNKVTTNSNNNGGGGAIAISPQYNNQNDDRIDISIENCTFSNNSIVPGSNGGQSAAGGAIYINQRAKAVIQNSLFYHNIAEGGISVQQWGTNYNGGHGGAIHTDISRDWNNSTNSYEYNGELIFINNTLTLNEARGSSNNGHGGGIYFQHAQQAYLFNNIVWGNKANSSDDEQKSIYFHRDNNDFRWSNNSIQYVDATSFGDNNLKENPEFVGSGTTPYALHDRSTLIGAGVSSYENYSAPTTDITGVANSRPNPSGSNPDLGAYENRLSTTPYPSQVAGLKAKGGDGSVTLSWTANSETDMAKYFVYRDTSSFTAGSSYLIDSTTTTTYTNTGLNNATRYYFRVAAVNSSGYVGAASQSIDITPAYTGPVWYMAVTDSGGSDSNEGSEASPLLSLSKAVEKAATGDTILIGDGTYSGGDNREVYIDGSKQLVIQSINGKEKVIFDAGGFGRHLVLNINDGSHAIDSTFVIEGITFKNGGKNSEGGSIRIVGYNGWNQSTQQNITLKASPKFKNCTFYGNNASWYGGAIYIDNGDPIFESCLFDSNSVDGTGSSNQGGAVYVNDGSPQFRSTTFSQNKAYFAGNTNFSVEGGAIYFHGPESAKILDCTFSNNQAYSTVGSPSGGAIFVGDDYDITNNEELTIDRTTFNGNTNEAANGGNNRGGALYIRGGVKITNSLFYDNHVYTGGNGFWPGGGAISFEIHGRYNQNTNQQEYPRTYLINNTIVNNTIEYVGANAGRRTGSGGGINMYGGNNLNGVWFNNIIWSNESESNKDIEWDNQTPLIFGHNVVEDVYSGIPITENLYSKDPKFTDTTNHVYSLSDASYLIGKGVSSFDGIYAPNVDINGSSRPNPSGSSPDMGAFEHELEASPYPSQVANLAAKGGHKLVSLAWDANSETDIASYTVYMSTVKDFIPSSADSLTSVTTNSYTTSDTLINKTEYFFAVAAINEKGNMGEHSETVHAIPYYRGPKWYVAVDGNNTNDGDQSSPLSDLQTAIDSAKTGHEIILLAGTHTGPGNRNIRLDTGIPLSIYGDLSASADEVILDAENSGNHFEIEGAYDSTLVFANITFTRGSGMHDGDQAEGGSFRLRGDTYWDDDKGTDVHENPSPKFVNCIWTENNASGNIWGKGGAIHLQNASPEFFNCVFENNSAKTQGGAIVVSSDHTPYSYSAPIFRHTIFKWNAVNNQSESSWGGAVSIAGGASMGTFIDCRFESNSVRSQDRNANGGAVRLNDWTETMTEFTTFERCVFVKNYAESVNAGAHGGAISSESPITIINSLVVGNQGKGDHGGGGGLNFSIHDRNGTVGQSVLINNTIVGNEFRDRNGNYAHGGGGIMAMGAGNQGGLWFNTIVYGNRSGNDNSILKDDGANIDMSHLNVDDEEGKPWFNAETMTTHKPKFKNPGGEDFRLSFTSQLIDAGTDHYGGQKAPTVDIRNYYRLGTTDIGAYEFGASKYILDLADDISPISRDTTYLSRDQEFNITIKTNDNQGNIVTAEERVKWFIAPTDKHVTIVENDTVTSNGEASVKVKATGITGFKFRVGVDIADAVRVTELYIIERQVTGAPPPVSDIAISPSDWTNQNKFTISWTNPDEGAYGREFLGAVVKLGDDYPEYINRTSETQFDVNTVEVEVPELGEWQYKVWLVDELGNDSEDSASAVTAKFDNQSPDEFWLHYPSPDVWESDKPRFHWSELGDYPSGIKEFHIFLNENHYAKFQINEVTYNESNEEFYVDAPTSIPDGNYSWHVEAWDFADNITWSNDTVHFGVDVTAPLINHSNPLTVVDEGSTTPAITVDVSDGASGVKETFLYYRRSGGGGGFVSVDMSSGSYSIPGGDVKSDGLEYYIESEDNVGNTRYWPAEGEFHSVKVRTENSVSTASRWPSGVPGGTDSTNYVFFSIPFDVGNAKSAITSILDPDNEGPNEFNYRLYGYSNGWQENPSSVTMGNGYFLIYDPDKYSDNPQMHFDFGQGTSTPTEPPYGFGVTTGQWKFFGSPYNFNVSLDNIYTEDGTNVRDAGSIYTWNSSWSSAGSSLQPWKGYIFKSGGATKLNIDVRGSTFGKMSKAMNPDDYPMDGNEWVIDMIATTGNARDELNSVGVRSFASDGYDPLDEFEPPGVPGDVVLRIDNRNRQETPDLYAKDIRKPNEEGHYWDLQVFAPTNGQRTYITFEGLGYVPDEYDVFLINKTTKQAKNLEWDSQYRFANTGSDSYLKQELRLVVGTKKFVEDNNAGVSLYPDAFTLAQNYPNPFNPQTSIMISLEEDANVDLIIYNLLGEEITRLAHNDHRPAGYYNFIWNGRNNLGDKVSTGVYFYHALIRNGQGKVVLNKTKKMIFLK